MRMHVFMAVDASVEKQLLAKILPSVAEGLHIVGRWSDQQSFIFQVTEHEQVDVLIYDPSVDDGVLLQHIGSLVPHALVCCWCSRVEDVLPALRAGVLAVFLETSTAADIDIALSRCRRLLEQRANSIIPVTKTVNPTLNSDVVALPHTRGIEVRSTESIVHVQGEGNYTSVVFDKEPALLLSRTLGDYEDVFRNVGFLRVHRSHIVNLRHVRRVIRGKNSRAVMSNGDEVEISDRYKRTLLRMLNVVKRK